MDTIRTRLSPPKRGGREISREAAQRILKGEQRPQFVLTTAPAGHGKMSRGRQRAKRLELPVVGIRRELSSRRAA